MSNPSNFVVCSSVTGSAHINSGLGCQDCSNTAVSGRSFDTTVLAISDGAGSSKFSDVGSLVVVEEILSWFTSFFADHPRPQDLIRELEEKDVIDLLADIKTSVDTKATEFESSRREFAATMLGAVVHPEASFLFQIGDGCWVFQKDGVLDCATWPQQFEYASQTVFATCDDAQEYIQVKHLDEGLEFVVGFTDGLEMLALDFDSKSPSPKFFQPLLRGCLSQGQTKVSESLETWLGSEQVCERTDDDKTLAAVIIDEGSIQR